MNHPLSPGSGHALFTYKMKVIRTILVFIGLVLLTGRMVSQTSQMLRDQAYHATQNKDWYTAAQYYARLYDIDSTNLKLQFRYAEASRLSYDYDMALRMYYKVAERDNGRRFPLTYYWIADILKAKEQYKLAKQYFAKFSKLKIKDKKAEAQNITYFKNKSKIEIDACDLAQIYIKYPVNAQPEKLDVAINTRMSEYAPVERDSTLYFSSVRPPERRASQGDAPLKAEENYYSKIYRSEIRRDKYKKIKALDTTFNSNVYHAANTTFSPDNKLVVFSRCAPLNAIDNACQLYQSTILKTRWMAPVPMPAPLNLDSVSTTQPHFTVIDEKTYLFFSSNRPGGFGGLDIWYALRNDNGTFNNPVNAGASVNTVDDDISPWYDREKNLLYFSSTYHKGLGGYDIFKSEFKNGQFGEAQNAGYPINSSRHDTYFSLTSAGTRAYLSSNRVGSTSETKSSCCNDIYRYAIDTTKVRELPPAIDTVKIVKEQLKLLVPLTLYFHNDEPEPKTTLTVTTKNYVKTYEEYRALEPTYNKEYSAGLKGDQKQAAQSSIENFFTDSVEAGVDQLNKFADLLEKVLQKGDTVRITMKGYCSPLASTDYNIKLAKRRISSLRNYFRETKNGLFLSYIDNQEPGKGKIILEDVDIGELPTTRASDNFKDKRNSVYSPFAASERKIQIIAVSYGEK